MKTGLTVVANLDRSSVSWANTFCGAVASSGARVVSAAERVKSPVLYIGDSIDWDGGDYSRPTGYFLAAVDGTGQERRNVEQAQITTTVSRAEQTRAARLLGGDRVVVDGFPVDFTELQAVADQGIRRLPSIGFIGRTDEDKGPNLELLIAKRARTFGVKVMHASHIPVARASELTDAGVEVITPTSRKAYLGWLASVGCVINTSPRESLFVSGIEASYLGVPVVAPCVEESGIEDWNHPDRYYDASSPDQAVDLALELAGSTQVDVPDVSRYGAQQYVRRVLEGLSS